MAGLLIRAGADVNTANELGITPLMLASTNGNGVMVGELLRAGADPAVARQSGETALMMASRSGSVAAVRGLVAYGADVNATTTGGRTALMWAAGRASCRCRSHASPSGDGRSCAYGCRDSVSPGPSVREQRTKSVNRFVAANPRYFPRDGDRDPPRPEGGFTPLLYAVLSGDIDTLRELLAAGVSVAEAGPDGVTALMLAITKRQEPTALFLLDRGADPNPADAGYTALHLASATGQLAVAEALLARGVDPNIRLERPQRLTDAFESGVFRHPGIGRLTQIGSTPLIVAAKSADAPMMRLLAANGANPQLTTNDGTTALMLAAGLGKRAATDLTYFHWTQTKAVAAITVGLELGIDINAANIHGRPRCTRRPTTARTVSSSFLWTRGADINATNAAEQTALRIADGHLLCCTSFIRYEETVERLRELGADSNAGIQLIFGLTGSSEDPVDVSEPK